MLRLERPLAVRPAEPNFGKNYMIEFETVGSDPEVWDVTAAFNIAILDVMKEAKLNPFHQVGDRHSPGYHGWEALFTTTTDEVMRGLLPKIEARARECFEALTGNPLELET